MKESPLSKKEWLILAELLGLSSFYYVVLRWVILANFCSPDVVAFFTKTRFYPRMTSILGWLVVGLTLTTYVLIALFREYKKERRK